MKKDPIEVKLWADYKLVRIQCPLCTIHNEVAITPEKTSGDMSCGNCGAMFNWKLKVEDSHG